MLTLTIALTTPAFAQAPSSGPDAAQDGGGLSEIIVTATKRSENLQDVPVAVSAITAETLTNSGAFETSDLNRIMPNLQVSSPYGQQQPNFSLRGVGVGTEYNANAASPVGVYVDEVYQSFRSSHGQQLFDLRQIEVVRGPQGTLYGRNTTGGAINFITRKPELEGSNGYAVLGYGDYNRFVAEGAFEFTPVVDVVGVRLAGTYVSSDPYVENRLPAGLNKSAPTLPDAAAFGNRSTGEDPGVTESYGVRGTIVVRPNDFAEFSFKAYHAEANGGTETPIATGQSRTNDTISYTNPNFLLSGLFSALAPAGLLPASYSASARGLDDLEVEADSVGRAVSRASGAVLSGRIDLSDSLKIISTTGYDSGLYLQSPTTDCDATPLRLCTIGYRSSFDAWNQDLRLDYDGDKFKIIFGAYYGEDSISADNRPDFFNILSDVRNALGLPATYFNPAGFFNGTLLPADALPTGIRATQHFTQHRSSYAVYGEGSYALTDTVTATAGLRYTSDENRFSDGISTFFDDAGTARLITVSNFNGGALGNAYFLQPVMDATGTVVLPAFSGAPFNLPLPGPLERKGESNSTTGRLILDWKPTEESKVYVSYSRGYRAGTFNGLAYASASQVYFVPPEAVDAYEIGLKSRFANNRVQFNAAAFHYDYKGQQGQVVDSSATANLVALDGSLDGLEVEFLFAPTESLTINASFGLLDSSYDNGACPAAPILSAPPQVGNCVASGTGNVNVGGNPFPYAAETSANLGFDWDAMKIADGTLSLHADAAYTGKFYYDSFKDYTATPALQNLSTGQFSQGEGEYWVLNSRLTFRTDRYSVALWGKNLTDETYYPFGIAIENLFGNGYRVRAQPRTYGVEASLRF